MTTLIAERAAFGLMGQSAALTAQTLQASQGSAAGTGAALAQGLDTNLLSAGAGNATGFGSAIAVGVTRGVVVPIRRAGSYVAVNSARARPIKRLR